jgi:hypothetical protein
MKLQFLKPILSEGKGEVRECNKYLRKFRLLFSVHILSQSNVVRLRMFVHLLFGSFDLTWVIISGMFNICCKKNFINLYHIYRLF